MKVNGSMMSYKATVSILGVMEESSRDNGKKINFMEKVCLPGQMVEVIEANILTMLKAVLGFMNGQMAKSLKDNG